MCYGRIGAKEWMDRLAIQKPGKASYLVAFLSAATNPWQTQQRKGRICFGSVWGCLLLWWCRLVAGAWGNCSFPRKQRGGCWLLTHFLFSYSTPPQPMEWDFLHLGWVVPPKCRKSFLNKSKGCVSSVALDPVTLTIRTITSVFIVKVRKESG